MKNFLKTIRSRKGITMTEVIVAMAMVVIVTGAAISLVVASVQFDAKYESQTAALNAAESAVECVRFASTVNDLHKEDGAGYLDKLGFDKVETIPEDVEADSGYELKGNNSVKIWVKGYTVTVTFDNELLYEKTFTSE